MTKATVAQVGFNVGVPQAFVAGWQNFLWKMTSATEQVTKHLAAAYTTDCFKTLSEANDDYATVCATSYALTDTYFQASLGNFTDEATARAAIKADIGTHITAHSTYLAAWNTVINNAADDDDDIETFYNMVLEDQHHFLLAFDVVVEAVDRAHSELKSSTDQMSIHTGTSLETITKTTIPAVSTAMQTLVAQLTLAHNNLSTGITVCLIRKVLPLPSQANIAAASTALTDVTTANSGELALFGDAVSDVFDALAADA